MVFANQPLLVSSPKSKHFILHVESINHALHLVAELYVVHNKGQEI